MGRRDRLSPRRALACLFAAALVAAAPPPAASATWRSAPLSIPVANDDGSTTDLVGRACRPSTDRPATVVVIAHGSPAAAERAGMTLFPCDQEAAAWFLERGFVVVEALRRGYGATGGPPADSPGACDHPDYVAAGLEGARDLAAMVAAGTALPYARPDGAVVVGQSAGGWATLALSSRPHPDIAAFIAMEPGRGSHAHGVPDRNCDPDRLVAAAATFGATSRAGVLWLSTANDSYFGPALVDAMQHAFVAAGGVLTAVHLGGYGREGHHVFFGPGGSGIWGPIVARDLVSHGVAVSPVSGGG